MQWWALQVPPETVSVVDSFFGSHGLEKYFVSINRPFLTLLKRNKKDKVFTDAKQRVAEGQLPRGVIPRLPIGGFLKNPRLGTSSPA